MKRTSCIAVAAAIAVLTGCDSITGLFSHDCTSIAIWGITIQVQDSVSTAPAASGAMLLVADGSYRDSTVVAANRPDLDSLSFGLATERAGTYQVTVTRAGYRPWTTSNVRVTRDACHVRPVSVLARLVRAP